jgi:hypothetical protein
MRRKFLGRTSDAVADALSADGGGLIFDQVQMNDD